MDKKENTQEFSLEDIMREFGADASVEPDTTLTEPVPGEEADPAGQAEAAEEAAPAEVLPEEAPERPEADTAVEPVEAADPSPVSAPVTGDTIRLDDLTKIISAELAERQAEESGETPEEPEEIPGSEEDTPEAAAADAGHELPPEEIPQGPIVFTPRSRLRELKRKLVAGPEKRYYDLTEIGLGRVQAAIFVSVLIVLLCAGATTLYAMGMVMENRLRLMIFSQIFAMMISALLGCYVLMEGITDLFRGRFSMNTLLFFTLVACSVDALFCLQELRVPCCAAFCLEMTMALWNRSLRRSTEMGQMDTLRKAVRLDAIKKVPDYHEGRPGILRGEGEVDDFMDNYQKLSGPEKVGSVFTLLCLALCVGIAVLAGMLHGVSMGVQIFSASLLVAVPASFFVTFSRPGAILQRRLHMVGTVICGWQGVKGLCGAAAFPLRDQDLFPLGSSKLNGVKFYGDREPDETIAYAVALIRENGGGLEPVFAQLLKSRSGVRYEVENFQSYPGGGIGGEVCGEPVLLGTPNFLQDMGVEIPDGTMVSQAVYCSIDGQFSAVFAINYNRMKSTAGGLVSLCGYRKMFPVLLSSDFLINESFLRGKFGVKTKRFQFPAREVRKELLQIKPDPETIAYALTTQEGLSSAAYAVTGARSLRTACRAGLVIHMLAGILGVLIMAALAYLGATDLLTPINILLYQLVWMVPGLLISSWTRTV